MRVIGFWALSVSAVVGIGTVAAQPTPDFTNAIFGKSVIYSQTAGNAPVLSGNNPYRFNVLVWGLSSPSSGNYSITDGTLTGASSGSYTLPSPAGGNGIFTDGSIVGVNYQHTFPKFATQASLDAAFPAGNYTLKFNTIDGINPTFGLLLPAVQLPAVQYPGTPDITNLASLQSADANGPVTVNWSGFTDGSASDFVRLVVADSSGNPIYQSPLPGQTGALNGLSTSATLPAGILAPGETYMGELDFVQFLNSDFSTYAGAEVQDFYSSGVHFDISTPEPYAMTMVALGLVGLLFLPRRRRA